MAGPRRAWIVIALLAAVLAAIAASVPRKWNVPAFATVRAEHGSSEALLLDRDGRPLHELRVDPTRRRAAWVPLSALSPALLETVVRIEDRRFYAHHGVDWRGLAGIAWRAVTAGERRGGSTITMQVVGLVDPRHGRAGQRTLVRKWGQVRAARMLERQWSKREILEAYLNLASFRGEVAGIGAASRALAGRSADSLDRVDALLLTALLAAPNAKPRAVAHRACRLAAVLAAPPACAVLSRRASSMLAMPPALAPQVALAPHLARKLLGKAGSDDAVAVVRTSLDRDLQRRAREILGAHLGELRERNVHDGAVLVVDNATGEVLAYVGNQGHGSSAHHVDGVRARRQAGSTLKPFLYALALERRLLTAASLLDDSPVNLETPGGLYAPQNYDGGFKGLVSLRESLAGSLNIPAVRSLRLVGPDSFIERLRALGFAGIEHDAEHYGYALALGGAEVSLWELVEAYRRLARSGRAFVPAHVTPTAAGPAPPAAARDDADARAATFIIGDILADRGSRSLSFGLDSPLALPFWAAVKTGTSKHMRDNWCVGYSSRYTVGVWVGNFDGSPMWEVSGLSGAAPVWAELMRALHAARPGVTPTPPAGIERWQIEQATAPSYAEWFLAGTATTTLTAAPSAALAPRIAYPGRDSILVIDPDIPPGNQRVFFSVQPPQAAVTWRLDGAPFARGPSAAWIPAAGQHELVLVDAAATPLDRVRFTVR